MKLRRQKLLRIRTAGVKNLACCSLLSHSLLRAPQWPAKTPGHWVSVAFGHPESLEMQTMMQRASANSNQNMGRKYACPEKDCGARRTIAG
jgi:hypothetical protein